MFFACDKKFKNFSAFKNNSIIVFKIYKFFLSFEYSKFSSHVDKNPFLSKIYQKLGKENIPYNLHHFKNV